MARNERKEERQPGPPADAAPQPPSDSISGEIITPTGFEPPAAGTSPATDVPGAAADAAPQPPVGPGRQVEPQYCPLCSTPERRVRLIAASSRFLYTYYACPECLYRKKVPRPDQAAAMRQADRAAKRQRHEEEFDR